MTIDQHSEILNLTNFIAPWPINGKSECRIFKKSEVKKMISNFVRVRRNIDKVTLTIRDTIPTDLNDVSKRLSDYNWISDWLNSEFYRNLFQFLFPQKNPSKF